MFFSAVLVAANAALADLADAAGASDADRAALAAWLERGRAGLAGRIDSETGMCTDYDVRTGEDIRCKTFAGFAPLFAGFAPPFPGSAEDTSGDASGDTSGDARPGAQLRALDSADFCGDRRLRWRLLPSTSPADPAFESRDYWRGPVWPIINWLLWRSLNDLGCPDRADALRRDSLSQIAGAGEFNEYFEPFTGKPLGSPQQSWTAAVALDWLAAPGQ